MKANLITVLTKTKLFKPESCEYYLHFNVKFPYPEKEHKKWVEYQTFKSKKQLQKSVMKRKLCWGISIQLHEQIDQSRSYD